MKLNIEVNTADVEISFDVTDKEINHIFMADYAEIIGISLSQIVRNIFNRRHFEVPSYKHTSKVDKTNHIEVTYTFMCEHSTPIIKYEYINGEATVRMSIIDKENNTIKISRNLSINDVIIEYPDMEKVYNYLKNLYIVDVNNKGIYSYMQTMASKENWIGEFMIWNKEKAEALFKLNGIDAVIKDDKWIKINSYPYDGGEYTGISLEELPFYDIILYVSVFSMVDENANVFFYNSNTKMLPLKDCLNNIKAKSVYFVCKE